MAKRDLLNALDRLWGVQERERVLAGGDIYERCEERTLPKDGDLVRYGTVCLGSAPFSVSLPPDLRAALPTTNRFRYLADGD